MVVDIVKSFHEGMEAKVGLDQKLYSVHLHLSPCNCYKEGFCSDKHDVQIALLIGNVQ